jgi:lipid II:glycine glycyltransferase (peptidoglycan interpeptide bridge formation enzyme)
MLPGLWSVTVEKNDFEVTREYLKSIWISHGIIYWTPIRRLEKPIDWFRLPTWITKRNIHSSRSAFSLLDTLDYSSKWSSSARAHRRHVLENIQKWIIRIEETDSVQKFLELYTTTKIHDPNKKFVARMTERLFTKTESAYRIYIAYVNDIPLAWAIFIDEGMTSEYWASFYHEDSKPYHLWIAIMDRWFLDSYKKWIKYMDLDHMRDVWQSWSFLWYTKFKESIADFDVYFHDMWIKIF